MGLSTFLHLLKKFIKIMIHTTLKNLTAPKYRNLVNRLDLTKIPLENLVNDLISLAEKWTVKTNANISMPNNFEITLNMPDGTIQNISIDPPKKFLSLNMRIRGGYLESFDNENLRTLQNNRNKFTSESN